MPPMIRNTETINPQNIDDHPMPLPHANPDLQYTDSMTFAARALEITGTPYIHKCIQCDMAFLTATGLQQHIQISHGS